MGRKFLLTICGILNIPFLARAGTKELLVVKKGTGVSFTDLWDLNGYQVGSDTDDIYRNGIIDNGFTEDCPKLIYFILANSSLQTKHIYIGFTKTDNNTLQSWMTTDNINRLAHNINKTTVDLKFSPNEDIQLQLDKKGTQNDFYFFVHHAEDKAPYPIYYTVTNDYTVAGPIPPAYTTGLIEADKLWIRAAYNANCPLTLNSTIIQIKPDEAKSQIEQTKNQATTTSTQTRSTASTTKFNHGAATTTRTRETPTVIPGKTSTLTTNPSVTTAISPHTSTTTSTTTSETPTVTPDKTTTVTTNPSITTTNSPDTSTTTSASTVTKTSSTASGIPTEGDMCPCDCEYKRRLEALSKRSDIPIEELKRALAPEIKEIKANYTVDVSKLSSTRRKKQSAADKRESSEQIGIVGIVFIAFVFGMVLVVDLVAIKRHLRLFRNRNITD